MLFYAWNVGHFLHPGLSALQYIHVANSDVCLIHKMYVQHFSFVKAVMDLGTRQVSHNLGLHIVRASKYITSNVKIYIFFIVWGLWIFFCSTYPLFFSLAKCCLLCCLASTWSCWMRPDLDSELQFQSPIFRWRTALSQYTIGYEGRGGTAEWVPGGSSGMDGGRQVEAESSQICRYCCRY